MKKLLLIIIAILVSWLLYNASYDSLWRRHLEVDIFTFHTRAAEFFRYGGFSEMGRNEYLPGSLLFFLVPASIGGLSYEGYLRAVLITNLLLLGVLAALTYGRDFLLRITLCLAIFLAFGPILLFRFEVLVSLLVIISLLFWKRKKIFASLFILGVSFMVKAYPIVLLPYFFLASMKNVRDLGKILVGFAVGIASVMGVFFLLGGNIEQTLSSFRFHSLKPLGYESYLGNIITISDLIKGKVPELLYTQGVIGIASGGWDKLFNYFWVVPVLLIYLMLFAFKRINQEKVFGIAFVVLLVFVICSKNLNPQYLFWFISLFPFMKFAKEGKKDYLLMFVLVVVISILNQLAYPIFLNEIIDGFYKGKMEYFWAFSFLLIKHLLMLVLFAMSTKAILVKGSVE